MYFKPTSVNVTGHGAVVILLDTVRIFGLTSCAWLGSHRVRLRGWLTLLCRGRLGRLCYQSMPPFTSVVGLGQVGLGRIGSEQLTFRVGRVRKNGCQVRSGQKNTRDHGQRTNKRARPGRKTSDTDRDESGQKIRVEYYIVKAPPETSLWGG